MTRGRGKDDETKKSLHCQSKSLAFGLDLGEKKIIEMNRNLSLSLFYC
jgi:hypothetical protein